MFARPTWKLVRLPKHAGAAASTSAAEGGGDAGEAPRVVVERLEVADGYWSRFRGLQWRAAWAAGDGLLLVPCSSVHTFWMRFVIDMAFLDRTAAVLEVRRAVRPWRVVVPRHKSHAVLEVPEGTCTLEQGDRLRLLASRESQPPSSLSFLGPRVEEAAA